jgi:hypothetical protein
MNIDLQGKKLHCWDDEYSFILQKKIQANDDWPHKKYFW